MQRELARVIGSVRGVGGRPQQRTQRAAGAAAAAGGEVEGQHAAHDDVIALVQAPAGVFAVPGHGLGLLGRRRPPLQLQQRSHHAGCAPPGSRGQAIPQQLLAGVGRTGRQQPHQLRVAEHAAGRQQRVPHRGARGLCRAGVEEPLHPVGLPIKGHASQLLLPRHGPYRVQPLSCLLVAELGRIDPRQQGAWRHAACGTGRKAPG